MISDEIVVKGAREHNLRNVDVTIPRNKLVVITGVSGSGKSSLAFDTIYAEGQRRYVESLSAYARQFLGRMDKPDVDYIDGLSPAISIDQKWVSHNPRSTVGTVTEIYDYLRLLYARIGRPHCYSCGRLVQRQSVQQIVDSILNLPIESRIIVMAPKVVHKKGQHKDILEDARKNGYLRVRVDGDVKDLYEEISLDRQKWHTIEIVVDRIVVTGDSEDNRIADSVEQALKLGNGVVQISVLGGDELLFSEKFACVHCGINLGEIEPRTFSFNSPYGACSTCTGLGYRLEVDPDLVIPNTKLSLDEGAIFPWVRSGSYNSYYSSLLNSLSDEHQFPTNIPVEELTTDQIAKILYGDGSTKVRVRHRTRRGRVYSWDTTFEGIIPNLERRYRDTESDYVRNDIERYMASKPCPDCNGQRLKPESLSVLVSGKNIIEFTSMTIGKAMEWVVQLENNVSESAIAESLLTDRERLIADQILKEIKGRLIFLDDVGLDYLTLQRAASTLSGGEAQRIRLATQIGSGLTGVLYVCDEPSVGLHPVDDHRLITTLKRLRDLGNTIIIVEHDEAIMRASDHIIDLGPGAGEHGGNVVAYGCVEEIEKSEQSITGQYLSGNRVIPLPRVRRVGNGTELAIRGARANNLQNVDASIPLGMLVCVTGVSGSGKSSLIYEVLFKKLAQMLYRAKDKPGDCDSIGGIQNIDKVINIDQAPIGRTPRSNPATYTGAFTPIRELFATVPEARARGYAPGRFSFNVKGGRCENCAGGGYIQIEMQFLPDVTVPCEVCNGQRYNREALEITFKDNNISEVLNMTVYQALDFFWNFPKIRSKLETLRDVGLGYIRVGQPATTLSGGEAQRVKLATELSKRATGKTLYILDEPTTGLSFEDCASLLKVLHRLVDMGNTVVVIEHHLDLIKNADWVIDIGPGAGDRGGIIIASTTPEDLVGVKDSSTGSYLSEVLKENVLRTASASASKID
ncbi:MAG: excinuclease ABC subunit UvrA [SAR202 cluster bacterium]|nr:excinuclease ABC subunit UvrA [SAR202 cluster bacterium]|tara:strand:- start:20164 stop:23073 length:2910 start_codon:yes stop_codon:yes gene_type:complete